MKTKKTAEVHFCSQTYDILTIHLHISEHFSTETRVDMGSAEHACNSSPIFHRNTGCGVFTFAVQDTETTRGKGFTERRKPFLGLQPQGSLPRCDFVPPSTAGAGALSRSPLLSSPLPSPRLASPPRWQGHGLRVSRGRAAAPAPT